MTHKAAAQRTKVGLNILTTIIALVTVCTTVVSILHPNIGEVVKLSLSVFLGGSLIFSVFHMRKTI